MRHPGLLRFAEEEGSLGDPVAAIRRRMRRVVAGAMEQGWSGPPWNVELLASLNDIVVEDSELLNRQQDALWTSGRILVRSRAAPTRRRYSIAHEIVHSFLAAHDESAAFSNMSAADRERAEGELEYLCQVGAAELLIPWDSYRARMGVGVPHLRTLLSLASEFEVSPEASVRRAIDLGPGGCAALFAQRGDGVDPNAAAGRPGRSEPRAKPGPGDLVLTRYHASPDFPPIRIPIGELIPRTFHAYRAISYAESRPNRDHLYANIAQWPAYPEFGKVEMEAVPLPIRKRPVEVLILVRRCEKA